MKVAISRVLEVGRGLCLDASYVSWHSHRYQDYGGESYFAGHIVKVADLAFNRAGLYFNEDKHETILCCAYLHDVVEDTEITLDDLAIVFSDEIVHIVSLLTRYEGEPYTRYLERIKSNPIAAWVKWCEASVNARKCFEAGEIERAKKYEAVMEAMSKGFGDTQ